MQQQLLLSVAGVHLLILPVLSTVLSRFTIEIKQLPQDKLQLRLESIARDGDELPAKDYTPRSLITSYVDQQGLGGRQMHFSWIFFFFFFSEVGNNCLWWAAVPGRWGLW